MSSVFNSPFTNMRVSATSRRAAPVRSGLLHDVACWLGLARKRRASPHAPVPVPRMGWDHRRQAMLAAGTAMQVRAAQDNQPLSLVVFDLSDLPELEAVFGAAVAREVMTQVTSRLQELATGKGLVMRTEGTVFTVLMPGFGRDRALQAIERTMGNPCCIELDADDHEIVLVPEFKVHTLRPESGPLAQVYAALRRDIAAAQQLEQRRQRYLQLERESHTRPMELRTDSEPRPASALRTFAPMDATMPVPLKA